MISAEEPGTPEISPSGSSAVVDFNAVESVLLFFPFCILPATFFSCNDIRLFICTGSIIVRRSGRWQEPSVSLLSHFIVYAIRRLYAINKQPPRVSSVTMPVIRPYVQIGGDDGGVQSELTTFINHSTTDIYSPIFTRNTFGLLCLEIQRADPNTFWLAVLIATSTFFYLLRDCCLEHVHEYFSSRRKKSRNSSLKDVKTRFAFFPNPTLKYPLKE